LSLLVARGLACVRGGRLLFEGLDLTLGAGEAARVAGPNGAGKSSLLRVLAGLLRPAAGSVTAGSIALLAEATALDEELPLSGALRFWARMDAAPDLSGRVEAALADVGLEAIAGLPVRLLSTGQRRRAALARVIASPAALWLLDEPSNGLDSASIARLEATIARHRAGGGAVVVATHQPLVLTDAIEVTL
jgi:heme exporter protein A